MNRRRILPLIGEAVAPALVYLLRDAFSGVDGTNIRSHTPDLDLVGTGWLAANYIGDIKLISNKIWSNGSSDRYVKANVGAVDKHAVMDIELTGTGSNFASLYIRTTERFFGWFGRLRATRLEIVEDSTVRATYTATFATGIYKLKVSAIGSTITAEIDGIPASLLSYASSTYLTNTYIGLHPQTGTYLDNLEVW